MYTLAIVLCFGSVWALFSTANKVEFEKKGVTLSLSNNVLLAKGLSLILVLLSTLLLCNLLGIAVGILSNFVIWMIFGSAVALFAPFPKLRWVHLILIIVLFSVLEVLFHFVF
ncbi:MAG: hypothetical protein AAGB24_04715 [Bacteroidota bacterium]